MNESQSTMQEIKNLIERGTEIDPRTRDILLFSAAIETSKALEDIQKSLAPLLTFYRTAMWIGGIILTALITMAMSGTIQVTIK